MEPIKIVFLGSKPVGYACLKFLLENAKAINVAVIAVFAASRSEFAGEADLSALAAQHAVPVIDNLNDLPECDLIYSVQFGKILKPEHIAKARLRAVNLHMAPLPEYRGANQFSFAIIDGKKEFGTTIHLIDERIDHGDILFQTRFEMPKHCWVGQLYDLTVEASVKLFCRTLKHVAEGNFRPLPQADLVPSKGTSLHFKHEIVDLKRIDLNWPAEKIDLHVRATSMPGFEPPYCEIGKQKVYFTKYLPHG